MVQTTSSLTSDSDIQAIVSNITSIDGESEYYFVMNTTMEANATSTELPSVNLTTPLEHWNDRNVSSYLPYERTAEGTVLIMAAAAGILLNLIILIRMTCSKSLRTFSNGFMVHACLLNIFMSSFCVPFGMSILQMLEPPQIVCKPLGLSYVIALTVSMFNLLAIVMTEAYNFYEKNVDDPGDDSRGSLMCILFGFIIIYLGSIILHLGPTLIGGEFSFNEDVGICMFSYGKVQNYIMQVIWISIITLTMGVIFHYITRFYCQLMANERFRITNLARNAAAYSKGLDPNENIYTTVSKLKRKVKVFICMAIMYCICWYPLFVLTLIDYNYNKPRYLYRILTILAWSHSSLLPITVLSIDETYGIPGFIRQSRRKKESKSTSVSQQRLTTSISRDSSTTNSTCRNSLLQTQQTSLPTSNLLPNNGPKQVNQYTDRKRQSKADYHKHPVYSYQYADEETSDELKTPSDLDDMEIDLEKRQTK